MCSKAFKMTNMSFQSLSIDIPVKKTIWKEIIASAVTQVEIGWAEQCKLKCPLDSICLWFLVADEV